MLLRRIAGSVLTLLTLHLNVLGADFACAKHGTDEAPVDAIAGEMAMPAGMHMNEAATPAHATSAHATSAHATSAHVTSAHATTPAQSASSHASHASPDAVAGAQVANELPPCDVPVQPNCCKALASCNIFYSAAHELDVASAAMVHDEIARGAMHAPPSERAAPEPPPPKA